MIDLVPAKAGRAAAASAGGSTRAKRGRGSSQAFLEARAEQRDVCLGRRREDRERREEKGEGRASRKERLWA